ncbi:tRNA (adenosine(37)-N6)-threonylcarbamoyltransferase complex ATPase subunit type 1 TsaE [Candidatus Saccharibacteria bacterium]|nr:tRNA (adenosine(37)-N6)-threonylcarbamoyltransferase complex ATPase subunit type 1 TsaE [Candidatus Saccharibacteria bacterium]
MIWQTNTTSSEDTERLGELLGSQLKGDEVIELKSDLGGGKTTFTKGLVRGAGIKVRVSSPTFTLSRVYRGNDLQIDHFDFYRLNDAGILAEQLSESINRSNTVVVVEWADIVKDVLPESRLSIEFVPQADSQEARQVKFEYPEAMSRIISEVENQWQEARA